MNMDKAKKDPRSAPEGPKPVREQFKKHNSKFFSSNRSTFMRIKEVDQNCFLSPD